VRRVTCHGGGSGRNAVKSWDPVPLQLRACLARRGRLVCGRAGPSLGAEGGVFGRKTQNRCKYSLDSAPPACSAAQFIDPGRRGSVGTVGARRGSLTASSATSKKGQQGTLPGPDVEPPTHYPPLPPHTRPTVPTHGHGPKDVGTRVRGLVPARGDPFQLPEPDPWEMDPPPGVPPRSRLSPRFRRSGPGQRLP